MTRWEVVVEAQNKLTYRAALFADNEEEAIAEAKEAFGTTAIAVQEVHQADGKIISSFMLDKHIPL